MIQCHWDDRYSTVGEASVSWFEAEPRLSLELIERSGAAMEHPIIDIGGGASSLTARLQQRGFTDLTVLDISAQALKASRHGIDRPDEVTWIHADLLEWSPTRRWAVWHDRAVFHFLTEADDRRRYRDLLRRSVEPGSSVLIATFAEDGPTSCSALPVERYSADRLLTEIGPGFTGTGHGRFEHTTPSGAIQPLTWVTVRADTD